jgi:UDP-N-acetylglucosamine 1-carboxyvinyltransferase
MSKYLITGGKTLSGEVSIRGAKNASFKQIIASLLTDETVNLNNIPQISDVKITQSIASQLGSSIIKKGEHGIEINTSKITKNIVPFGTGRKSRSSFMFCAPLLVRNGEASFPLPGGDALGNRPLDRLFDCLAKMNIDIKEENNGFITMKTNKIKNIDYTFKKPSHTVTEVILMIASLTSGQTILRNCGIEPEIDDLIEMLNSMSADIQRDKNNPKTIIINGKNRLKGTNHQVISDRNEAVTFACAALATKGSVNILRTNPNILKTFLNTIQDMGAEIDTGKDEVSIKWVKPLKAIHIETGPEPMFMTDWQAIFTLVLSQAVGCSSIIERVFPYRFQHINYLEEMGLKYQYFNPEVKNKDNYYEFNQASDSPDYFHGVKIYGPSKLQPIEITINDLRAGASVTIAALTAQGQSIINGVEYIERGYEKLTDRLCAIGADIKYIKT